MKLAPTKEEKIHKAIELSGLMEDVIKSAAKGEEIYWENVYKRAVWILEADKKK